jgi:hypothetical protein
MRGTTYVTAALVLGLLLAVGPLFAAANKEDRPKPDQTMNIPIKGDIPEAFKKAGNQEFDVHFGTLTVGEDKGSACHTRIHTGAAGGGTNAPPHGRPVHMSYIHFPLLCSVDEKKITPNRILGAPFTPHAVSSGPVITVASWDRTTLGSFRYTPLHNNNNNNNKMQLQNKLSGGVVAF